LPVDKCICINNLAYEVQTTTTSASLVQLKAAENAKKASYNSNKDNLWLLIEEASKYNLYKSDGIKELKLKRDLLKEEIGVLGMKIDSSVRAEIQLNDIISQIDTALKDIQSNKDYKINTTIARDVPYKITGAITTHCAKSCHVGCSLNYGNDLALCAAMNGPSCSVCGCIVNAHCHLGWGQSVKYETVIKDDDNKKKVDWRMQREGVRPYLLSKRI